jgi:vacuolar-type H+-ATPase subunit H
MPRLIEELMDAEKRASSMVEEAKRRANEIIEEAKKEAEKIIEEAKKAEVKIDYSTNSDVNLIVEEAKKEAERMKEVSDARIKDVLQQLVRGVIFGEQLRTEKQTDKTPNKEK